MAISRRSFIGAVASTGAWVIAPRNGAAQTSDPRVQSALGKEASTVASEVISAPKGDWIASSPASAYRAYYSKPTKTAASVTWVQIDLGTSQRIEHIRIYPANDRLYPKDGSFYAGAGFPLRFKVEVSEYADCASSKVVADFTSTDFENPQGLIQKYHATQVQGRYMRLTATKLMLVEGRAGIDASRPHYDLPLAENGAGIAACAPGYYMGIAKIGVYAAGKEISAGCPVTADNVNGNYDDVAQITRADRADGEFVFVDHSENVTSEQSWKPAHHKCRKPSTGVTLNDGIFATAMERNIGYLLGSYSVDELLRQFRTRAGLPNPPALSPVKTKFWEDDLAGSNAGRFLMGAGSTLQWIDHSELRRRMNSVVDGIAACGESDGYIMAYPRDTIFFSERGAYTRAWVTNGLIEAGSAGNPLAFPLLRKFYDWFNGFADLRYMARFANQGGQGMIASTRLYFTPVGIPKDLQTIQRYFQENNWLDRLSARDEQAIWQYPYDRPHSYLLTNVLAYLDLYDATGDPRYIRAVEGAWELFRDKWEYAGGAMAIKEYIECPPGADLLYARVEELCGNVFWTFLNQRLHELDPEKEVYVTEIEKSIYNVALADQPGSDGFRQFAWLTHSKEKPKQINTCCEGQGTLLIGSLPEFIYSISEDGIYLNLFQPSTLRWEQGGQKLTLSMRTAFPSDSNVQLEFSANPIRTKIRVRVPSWSAREMPILVNGHVTNMGDPGSYAVLDRLWSNGDTIAFTLLPSLQAHRYTGIDQIPGRDRYSVTFGPLLLAAVGAPEVDLKAMNVRRPVDLVEILMQKPGQPLCFSVKNNPGIEYMPYLNIDQQPFSCFAAVMRRT